MPDTSHIRQPHLADAADILYWSDRVEARTEFPRLIRRLIQVNNDQVVRAEMRAAEGAGVPGFDGIVEASRGTPFVPEGLSVWELGTGADPQTKANGDYRKRTDKLGDGGTSEATFVFATSRRWANKRDWENDTRAENRWRDVRAFDVDDIEQALEAAPAVHVWFSEVVGKASYGAQSIEDWWNRFAGRTNPSLTPALVLAGREDTAAELLQVLAGDRRFTTIGGSSIDDDLAFVAAAILSAEDDVQSRLLGRTLIVREVDVLRRLDGASPLVVFVPFDGPLRREAEAVRGHHIVVLAEEDSPADLTLPSIEQRGFANQLTNVGVAQEEADRLAQAAYRSLRKFQRLASTGGTTQVPEWTAQLRSKIVRRAWLAGGWNVGKSGDADVLSAQFGANYSEFVDELEPAGRGADPLFTRVGDVWAVASPEDSWDYGSRQITKSDLHAVETAIQSVLGAIDPALELPIKDRWAANIYGKSRVHSSTLREGLAKTLALFGARGESVSLGSGETGRDWAEKVVFSLLDRANKDATGQLWSSLADVLPLLAEAAPDVFLRAVQVGLEGLGPLLRKLFIDQYDGLSVNSPHTGLLWALETLAWSGKHFGLATILLAHLAEIDPGGRLSNRPMRSLTDIFRPWLPQTSTNVAARLSALKALVSHHPTVGWSLLLGLVPERPLLGKHTHIPRFQDWKPVEEGVTPQELWEFSSSVAEQILAITQRDPVRWSEVAAHLSDFPPPQRTQAYTLLKELSNEALPDDLRVVIWEKLDEELRHHRAFPEAAWALPSTELDCFEQALEALKSQDPLHRSRWLFNGEFPHVGVPKRNDFRAYEAEVASQRKKAVAEILEQGGLSALSDLATKVSQSWTLGTALAENGESTNPIDVIKLLDSDEPRQVDFAFSYVVRASQGQLAWLLTFAEAMTGRPQAQARLLAACNELPSAWDVAKCLGQEVDAAYWKEFRIVGRGHDFALVNTSARHLLEHGRPAAALDLLAMYRDQTNDPVDPQTVVDTFETLLSQEDEEIRLLSNWEIERLLEFLRRSPMDEDLLASLEWRLLPALGVQANAPILERRLARDPAFFVQIVSLCFESDAGEFEQEVYPQMAQNAFRLLLDWRQVPGSDEPAGEIDEARLRAWMTETRQLLLAADRLAVGESCIGQVFAHARADDDGIWPSLPVRNMIEEYASTHLETGFRIGTVNKRRSTMRGLDEGGDQEYRLAQEFECWANAVADQWPRTAAVLRSIADRYRSEGRSHDEDARRFKAGLKR